MVTQNWIDGREKPAIDGGTFDKVAPADGNVIGKVARSGKADVEAAVASAKAAQPAWAARTPVERGDVLRQAAMLMQSRIKELSEIVAREAGKSLKDATGETKAAIEMGFFIAGEGRRFFGRTTTSAVPNKIAQIIRQPMGVAGLIVPANTPLPNIAWKAFPALLCGNSAVLKSSEDSPAIALAVAKLFGEAGVPTGVFNVVHGLGEEAGAPLVDHPDVAVVSFTGSAEVGRLIAQKGGARLAKVCVELGGKNPLIVCDDAHLESAAQAAALSAFSNAGQRCASGSRIIVFDAIHDQFRKLLVDKSRALKIGISDTDDVGPVINEESLKRMLTAIEGVKSRGGAVLVGGNRVKRDGYFLEPTLIEKAGARDPISTTELFGPIACLYRVASYEEALAVANDSPYGLTASIHTASIHRAMDFLARIRSGVAIVNGPTYGSEPHMPFGGLKQSGNGTREAGPESLDVYSELKTIYVNYAPDRV